MRRALLLTVTMNLEITQDNLYLILPGKVSWVVCFYAQEHQVPLIDVLRLFYRSETYKCLADESTKYWHFGPVALYQEWMEEVRSASCGEPLER